jgi:NADPH:quinone reductase-like Zn-dependent oxidoreductase
VSYHKCADRPRRLRKVKRVVVDRFGGPYLGVPKPPFTPGYKLVGVVDELGPGCSRLRETGIVSPH